MPWTDDNWYRRWLRPVGELYRGAARARRRAYEEGRRPQKKLPRPVLSIGNLTVGGTGKTPMVMYLCSKLSSWCRVAVLSRGYGRKNKRDYMSVPDPARLDERAALFFGDEPVMMARHLSNTSIHLGPNRYKNGLRALEKSYVDVFVLDDGFQHIDLRRDLDIVIVDGSECPRDLQTLPAGPLREPPEAIRRADIVVINHCGPGGEHQVDMTWLSEMCPDVPVVTARYEVQGLYNLEDDAELPLDSIAERPLYAFCGIARPDHFFDTLLEINARVVGKRSYPDHHAFPSREIRDLTDKAVAAGAEGLITTEKDVVRILTRRVRGLPVYYLRVGLRILEGEEAMWERIGAVLDVG